MTTSVLALPTAVLRTGGTLVKRLTKAPLKGAGLLYRAVRRSDDAPARVTPDPATGAGATAFPARAPRFTAVPDAPAAPPEPTPVIDPVPLAEPAVDLDVEVTLSSELPIRAYDALSAKDAAAAIRALTEADEVRTVLAFEQENSKRSTVLTAARAHLAVLERPARP